MSALTGAWLRCHDEAMTEPEKKPAKKAASKRAAKAAPPAAPALGTSSPELRASGHPAAQPAPANALFAAAQRNAARAGGDTAAHASQARVPATKPVRLEVKVNGRTLYAQQVYNPKFNPGDDQFTLTADMHPTMVEPEPLRPPTRFYDQRDPRDGEEFIPRVHSGRRDIPYDQPETQDFAQGDQ